MNENKLRSRLCSTLRSSKYGSGRYNPKIYIWDYCRPLAVTNLASTNTPPPSFFPPRSPSATTSAAHSTAMANFSDGTINSDAAILSEGEALASAGNMHKYLQTLLDNKEKQVQQAGTLGQRLLSQHAELEELVRQLQDIDGDKSEDAEISAELRLRYRDLVNTLASWEEENKQLSNAFAIKVDAFFKFNELLELIKSIF